MRALVSFHAPGGRFVAAGDEVAGDDPIVKGRESLFDTDDTAAPAKPKAAKPKAAKPKADG